MVIKSLMINEITKYLLQLPIKLKYGTDWTGHTFEYLKAILLPDRYKRVSLFELVALLFMKKQ